MRDRLIRLGIIGFGRMARGYHLPSLKKISGVRVTAVAESRPERRDQARRLGIDHIFYDFREMLDRVELDGVLVCTPPWLHRVPTELAAGRGVAVFCEKPMATTLADCEAMIAACEAAGVPLYMGFIRRFDPGFGRVRRAVQSGELGKVFHAEAIFNYWVPDIASPPWSTVLGWAKDRLGIDLDEMVGTWRITDPKVEGGVFQDHGPHYADLFRWILGDEIESVSAIVSRQVPSRAFEDETAALLRFRSGCSAYLQIGLAVLPGRDFTEFGVVHGTRGSLRFKISAWWFVLPYAFHLLHRNRLRKFSLATYPLNIWRPVFTGSWRDRWMGDLQMEAFVEALRGEETGEKRTHLATGADGRKAMEVVIGAYRSSDTGETVRMEDLRDSPR